MSALRTKAFEIVDQNNIIDSQYIRGFLNCNKAEIENSDIVIQARKEIHKLRYIILEEYQGKVFNGISELLEREWRKQQYEATKM